VKATQILAHWEESVAKFVKVIPKDYKRMLQTIEAMKASGMEKDEAVMAAFKANSSNKSQKVDETLQTIGS
jgi:glutamate synthase (NADPH/NADH) large chain